MATRFLATVEAPIRQEIKDKLASKEADETCTTVVLSSLSNSTRVFKNKVSKEIIRMEDEMKGRPDFKPFAPLASGARAKEMWQKTGAWDDAMWSCGQSVGLIDDVPT